MAVPTSVADLSVTAASNSPAGADSVTSSTGPDDYLRALAAIIRREQAKGANVASASTVDLGAIADGNYIHITGTTTITAFGTVAAGIERTVVFDGALTLTHNGTSLILPGGANITTAAGDVAVFVSEGSGNWRCKAYSYGTGISAYIKTLLDDADASAALSTLGLSAFVKTLMDDADSATARATLEIVDASETAKGLVELATTTEAAAGTDTARAVTAAGVAAAIAANPGRILAWVLFDGTGTPAVRGSSSNVSATITDNGTGDYTIGFSPALSHAHYAVSLSTNEGIAQIVPTTKTTSALRLTIVNFAAAAVDDDYISVTIIG